MKLSACIIAKNEEKNLPRLLKSITGKFDEIILVDTGSTDRTKEIAKSFGCKVFEHKWNGFADARNRAVKEATGDWLWHFDADFELEEGEYRKALTLFKRIPKDIEALSIGVKNFDSSGRVKALSFHTFIHRAGIMWKGKVHESPMTGKVIGVPIFVNHYGYSDKYVMLKKAHRNLKLLEEEIANLEYNSKDYIIKLFFLVQTYLLLSTEEHTYLSEAKKKAEEFLEKANWDFESYGFLLVYMLNYYLNILWSFREYGKLQLFLKKILGRKIKLPEIYFIAYKTYRTEGSEKKAFAFLLKTAELLDVVTTNPFSLPWGAVTECLPTFEREILNYDPPKLPTTFHKILERKWKKRKGRNLGLLLYWFSDGYSRLKVIEKLAKRYRDPFLEKLLFAELLSRKEKEKIRRLISTVLLRELFIAAYYDLAHEEDKAIYYYLQYLSKYKDSWIAEYVVNRFNEQLKSAGLPPIM